MASAAETSAQSASVSVVENASKNSHIPAQFFPICILIVAFRGGDAIDRIVLHAPLLLLVLAAVSLDPVSANTVVTMTGYGILSSSSSSLSSSSPCSINYKLMYICRSSV